MTKGISAVFVTYLLASFKVPSETTQSLGLPEDFDMYDGELPPPFNAWLMVGIFLALCAAIILVVVALGIRSKLMKAKEIEYEPIRGWTDESQ